MFATDASGAKVWEATYLPFGGVHASTGDPMALRFPGQWFQSESGLHQNWMRNYDPTTGRYMQADPLGLVDGASVYGYARQNPGRYVDPRGEQIALGSSGVGLGGGVLYPGGSTPNVDWGGLWDELREFSDNYNPITKASQWISQQCTDDDEEKKRCEIIFRKCRQNCIDYFVEGPFPGHSGSDQFAGMRRCIRECMAAHDCPY